MERFNWGTVCLAAAALTLAVTAAWPARDEVAGQASYRPPRGALIAPGAPADLTLLYTGDVVGYVDLCG